MSKNKLPIIGIPGWKTADNAFGCTLPYIEYFNQFGNIRIIMPDDDLIDDLDLLVLTGGVDIDPLRYGEVPSYQTSKSDPIREHFDKIMLPQYIENNTPIYGICRGMQSIGVHFGARLIQDMWHETSSTRSELVHELNMNLDGFTYSKQKIKVNSMHHQCISHRDFPECLDIIGTYKGKQERSCIEAIKHKILPIYGVQYHPEELINNTLSDHIVELLISKSKNYA